MKELMQIQAELKAPKGRYNSFGKYKYRSCEDILEAVKPLLAKCGCTMTITDEIVEVGGRIYVKATASIKTDADEVSVTAFAREPDAKKGMDESQITGTASSYARKYALNGLFLIDDTKDADTDEYAMQNGAQDIKTKKIDATKAKALEVMLLSAGQDLQKFLDYYKVSKTTDLTEEQHYKIVEGLKKRGSNGQTARDNT